MEWTGQQQLWFLLQSVLVGTVMGVMFDTMTGVGRAGKKRRMVFWLDSLFGVLAALITFFASLVITNGRLHPLLFSGMLLGMIAEHFLVGWLLSRLVSRSLCFIRRVTASLSHFGDRLTQSAMAVIRKVWGRILQLLKKCKKIQKKHVFFTKKT